MGYDKATSRIGFETLWQPLPLPEKKPAHSPSPRFLGEERERRLRHDPRYLPNVIARIKASVKSRKPDRVVVPTIRRGKRSRRDEIVAELGLIFSTCTFAEAEEIIYACNDVEKKVILTAFMRTRSWQTTRLGKEIAPKLAKAVS